MKSIFFTAPQVAKKIIHEYYEDGVLAETIIPFDLSMLKADSGEFPKKIPCEITDEKYTIVFDDDEICSVAAFFRIISPKNTFPVFSKAIKLVLIFCEESAELKAIHIFANDYSEYICALSDNEYDLDKSNYVLEQNELSGSRYFPVLPRGVKVVSADSGYSFVFLQSALYYDLLGYTYQEFMTRTKGNMKGLVFEDDWYNVVKTYKKALESSEEYLVEYRVLCKSGLLLWVVERGAVRHNKNGQAEIVSIVSEMTQGSSEMWKRLKLDWHVQRAILENMQDWLFEYDIAKDCLILNENVTKNGKKTPLKRTLENYLQLLVPAGLVHPDDQGALKKAIKQKAEFRIDLRTRLEMDNPESPYHWQMVHGTFIFNGENATSVVGTVHDISTEKKEQEEREKLEALLDFVVSSDYHFICLIDTVTQEYRVFDLQQKLENDMLKGLTFIRYFEELLHEIVNRKRIFPEDVDLFLRSFSIKNMCEKLDYDERDWEISFRTLIDGTVRWKVAKWVYCNNDKNKILLSFRDIHQSKVRSHKEFLISENLNILMNDNYTDIFQANLTTDNCYFISRTVDAARDLKYSEIVAYVSEKLIFPKDRKIFEETLSRENLLEHFAQNKSSILLEVRRLTEGDNQFHWISISVCKLENRQDSDCLLMILVTDIDIKKRAEEKEKELQAESKQILETKLKFSEKSNASKSEFLSRISHDIRTPMNAILGMASIALKEYENSESVKEHIQKIDTSARFLLELINDVLDVSKIESGKMELIEKEFWLPQLVIDLLTMIYTQAEERGIQLNFQAQWNIDEWYIGDAVRINQILMNLFSNSLKYTMPSGKIDFAISEVRSEKGRALLRFTIEDTGCGISKEFQKRMFQPFEQANSGEVNEQQTGTGLGLAIVYSFVKMMNGEIIVDSDVGCGTKISIEIPLTIVEKESDNSKTAELAGLKILMINKTSNISILVKELKLFGITIELVDSLEKAEKSVNDEKCEKYDGVIINWDDFDFAQIEQFLDGFQKRMPMVGKIALAYDLSQIKAGADLFLQSPIFKSIFMDTLLNLQMKNFEKATNIKSEKAWNFNGECILIAEDNDLNAEILQTLLGYENLKVERAVNGYEAVKMFKNAPPSYYAAILMDIRMPVMDGLSATKKIRSIRCEDAKDIPIIAMSANAFDSDVKRSYESGMNEHLSKPINIEKVCRVLSEEISKRLNKERFKND